MGINFPNAPTIGQLYPSPATPGLPVYQWDGEKWTTGPPNIPDGLVHYDIAQSLTTPQIVQARSNIYAAPFDAMSYSGMQINGSMEVSQELGSGAWTTLPNSTLKFFADQWSCYYKTATGSMYAGVWPLSTVGLLSGFKYGLILACPTALSALANGDYAILRQNIEGYRIIRLAWGTANAQPLTIGFWAFSSVVASGTFFVRVSNSDFSQNYYFEKTVTSTGWSWFTQTIPGPTSGTWATDNTVGIRFDFCFAGKEAAAVPTGTWTATNTMMTASNTNFLTANNNQVGLTGLVVLPGTQGPTAAQSPLIMRPYDQELLTCKRYYQKIGSGAGQDVLIEGYQVAAGYIAHTFYLPVEMCKLPGYTLLGTWNQGNLQAATYYPGVRTFAVQLQATATGTLYLQASTNGMIQLDARL